VEAVTAAGTGPESQASDVAFAAGAPGPPTAVSARVAGRDAVVTWLPPTNDGGSAVLRYRAESSAGGSCVADAGATSCLVSGLKDAVVNRFTVVAVSAVAASRPSESSNGVAAGSPTPGAPVNVELAPGPTPDSVIASWLPPMNSGAAAITHFVASDRSGRMCVTRDPAQTSCVITGLAAPAAAEVVVRAGNQFGTGATSRAAGLIDGAGNPAASGSRTRRAGTPRSVATSGQTAPADGLTAVAAGESEAELVADADVGTGDGSAGTSAPTLRALVMSADSPRISQARYPTRRGGTSRLTASWHPPDGVAGSLVRATASPGDVSCSAPAEVGSCDIQGLTRGQGYRVVLRAYSSTGWSAESTASVEVVAP